MACCSWNYKHNNRGYCTKYQKSIHKSLNPECFGLLLHPLQDLDIYYQTDKNLEDLIEIADKNLTSKKACGILEWYKTKGFLTEKQRKYLVYVLLNCCFERKPVVHEDHFFCQIED